jgi:hypothetical protein
MTRLAAVVADDWAGWNAELSKWLMEWDRAKERKEKKTGKMEEDVMEVRPN